MYLLPKIQHLLPFNFLMKKNLHEDDQKKRTQPECCFKFYSQNFLCFKCPKLCSYTFFYCTYRISLNSVPFFVKAQYIKKEHYSNFWTFEIASLVNVPDVDFQDSKRPKVLTPASIWLCGTETVFQSVIFEVVKLCRMNLESPDTLFQIYLIPNHSLLFSLVTTNLIRNA